MSKTIDDFRNFFKPDKLKIEFDIKEAVNKALSIIKDSLSTSFVKVELKAPDIDIDTLYKIVDALAKINEYCNACN